MVSLWTYLSPPQGVSLCMPHSHWNCSFLHVVLFPYYSASNWCIFPYAAQCWLYSLFFTSYSIFFITDPHGRKVDSNINRQGSNLRVEFTPTEVGPHVVTVSYAKLQVGGSPYTCYCYDASRVIIKDVTPHGQVGQDMEFTGQLSIHFIYIEIC